MCQTSKVYEKVKTAENDITVYKIVKKIRYFNDEEIKDLKTEEEIHEFLKKKRESKEEITFEENSCESLYTKFLYEKDKVYTKDDFDNKINISKETPLDYIFIDGEGYHSYIEGPQKEFIYKGIYVGKDLSVMISGSLSKEDNTYARFVIPKGSRYIEGIDDYNNKTYVSNSIVFIELLHWDSKNSYYGRH